MRAVASPFLNKPQTPGSAGQVLTSQGSGIPALWLSGFAGPVTDSGGQVFNVKASAYAGGAKGDGITDDTAAILAAVAACMAAGGGIVLFPVGIYVTSASIVIPADYVHLLGAGFATVIQPASGANFDVISTAIPSAAGVSGYTRNYISAEEMKLDCSKMTGTTAGKGNGIHFYGVRYSRIARVFVSGSPNWAVVLDGDNTGPGNNFGYNVLVREVISDLGAAGILTYSCEACWIEDCLLKYAKSACAASQPAAGSKGTYATHIDLDSGYSWVTGCVLGKGGTYNAPAILTENSGPCKILGNRFDQVRAACIELRGGNHIFADNAMSSPGSAAAGWEAIRLSSNGNTVKNNVIDNTAGTIGITYSIADGGSARSNNIIEGNHLWTGTSGVISETAGSTNQVRNNAGYNPVGVEVVAVPGSGGAVAVVSHDRTFYVTDAALGCTLAISNGPSIVVPASQFATVRLPAGQTLTVSYTNPPTWVVEGE